jgi:hypothetical protein
MPDFKLLAPGGWGAKQRQDYSYSMVMEVDGRVELSGQGGWDPDTREFPTGRSIEAEINQAFDNVAAMLGAVGLGWANVAHVNSYHVAQRHDLGGDRGNGPPVPTTYAGPSTDMDLPRCRDTRRSQDARRKQSDRIQKELTGFSLGRITPG